MPALISLLLSLTWASDLLAQTPDAVLRSDELVNPADVAAAGERVYVADWGARSVLMFDATSGRFVDFLGREGKGPLEFIFPNRLGWLADTLWVRDQSNNRLILVRDGRQVGSLPFSGIAPSPVGGPSATVHAEWAMADGSLVAALAVPWDVLATGEVDSIPYFRMRRDSGVGEQLFARSTPNEIMKVQHPRERARGAYWPQPFAPGEMVTAANGAALYVVDRSTYTVEKLHPSGERLWISHQDYSPKRASKVVEAELDRLVTLFKPFEESWGVTPEGLRNALSDALYVPDLLPPVSAIASGADETLWVRREASGEVTVQWDVIDAAGKRIGSVRLPSSFEGFRGDQSGIWGVERDEDQVPAVVHYPFR